LNISLLISLHISCSHLRATSWLASPHQSGLTASCQR